jgi:hypothetical protein
MPHRTKPKQEGQSVVSSSLGLATIQFITMHNLTQFQHILTLIIANHSPTKWESMLGVLSLSDDVHNELLNVLTADLESGGGRN